MTIGIPDALQSLCPGAEWTLRGNEYAGLEWLDKVQTKPTFNEVQDCITMLTLQAPFDACKAKAKELIAATDWVMLADVTLQNRTDYIQYRFELRELIKTPVQAPIWPVEPQPVWSNV